MKHLKKLIPNIFVLTEGETEKIYLNHLKQRGHNYSLHIQSYGRNDPLKMVKRCNEIFRNRGMSVRRGDYAFCVMDVDNCKDDDFREALQYSDKHRIQIILSNPCFEVFLLLHFTDNIPRLTSKEMKKELSNYIDGYRETVDYWNFLMEYQPDALKRSRCYHLENDSVTNGILGTIVWAIFDLVERLKTENDSAEE